MIHRWKSLSYTTRFSVVSGIVFFALNFLSMGFLGALLYYPVSFLFTHYPTLNDWHGDWVWPVVIGTGMFWSLGFIFAGLAWHYLQRKIKSTGVLRVIYATILWSWAAILWSIVLKSNLEPL